MDAMRGGFAAIFDDERGAVIVEIVREIAPEFFDIQLASRHHLGCVFILGEREQQVFERRVFVLTLRRQLQGAVERAFETRSQRGHVLP